MRWELTLLFYCLLPSWLYVKLLNVVTSFNPYNTSLRCERRKLRCGEVKWHSQGQTFHVLSDEAQTPLCIRPVCYFLVAALLCRAVSSYWRSRTHPCNIFLEWQERLLTLNLPTSRGQSLRLKEARLHSFTALHAFLTSEAWYIWEHQISKFSFLLYD